MLCRTGRPTIDIFLYRHMIALMARAATTTDAFNAIAEPHRRQILTLLQGRERPVTDLASALGLRQPATSKHLRVLREVGLVHSRQSGKQRLYVLDARALQPIHAWTGGFERFWDESMERLSAYVKELQDEQSEQSAP